MYFLWYSVCFICLGIFYNIINGMRGLIKPLQEPDELLLMSLVFFCTCHAMHSNVQIESVACRIQTTYICEVKCLFYFIFLLFWHYDDCDWMLVPFRLKPLLLMLLYCNQGLSMQIPCYRNTHTCVIIVAQMF